MVSWVSEEIIIPVGMRGFTLLGFPAENVFYEWKVCVNPGLDHISVFEQYLLTL